MIDLPKLNIPFKSDLSKFGVNVTFNARELSQQIIDCSHTDGCLNCSHLSKCFPLKHEEQSK